MGKLYHYTTAEGLVGMIQSGKIHCTNSMFMNDPAERKYFDKILKIVLKNAECKAVNDYFSNKFRLYKDMITNYFNSYSVFLLSFVVEQDSLTMWRYYSKPNGCCIEFDSSEIINMGGSMDEMGHGKEIIEIIYDKEEQIKILKELILSFKEDMENIGELDNMRKINLYTNSMFSFARKKHKLGVSFKDIAYKDEKEKRLVICSKNRSIEEEKTFFKEAYDEGIRGGYVSAERYKTSEDYYNTMNYYDKIKHKTSASSVVIEYLEVKFDSRTAIKSVMLHPSSSKIQEEGVHRFLDRKGINVKVKKSKKPYRVM